VNETLLTREWVERRLALSPNYWVVTVRGDGRPHATPVWGVWFDGAVWFGTSESSAKGRNLARSPECVVHPDSGDDVVILEGRAERVSAFSPRAGGTAAAAVERLAAKYLMAADVMGTDQSDAALYRVRPRVVRGWLEPVFPQTQVVFDPW
jgi:hypothetical protein